MTGGRPPLCSFVAEAAGDAREGTAPPADQWFLLEHPGPWGRVPLTQSGIDARAVAAIGTWAAENRGRALLIRRPGRSARPTAPRRWFRVDSRPGREAIRTGAFDHEHELAAAVDSPGQPYDGPLHLVCSHGRHDTCCAVRGRPLVAALEAIDPTPTWECSHLGGCRFAPTLVLLPHGYMFGNVPPDDAAGVIKHYDAGLLDPRWLRGRTCCPPVVQAAQHHARASSRAFGVDALRATSVVEIAPARWRVALADPECVVELTERRVAAGRPLTCAATAPGWMREFELLAVTTRP